MNVPVWTAALGVSLLLHGVGVAAIAYSTDPDTAPDQTMPQSRFQIEAADAPRSRATPEVPQADAIGETREPPATAQAGTIRQTRAAPATPAAERLSAATPQGAALPAGRAPAETASLPLAAPTLPALDASADVAAAALPAVRHASAALETTAARPAARGSDRMPALSLPATAGKAALAWSGEKDAPISAASLAAIAAFTQAGDLAADAEQVRDGIEGILAAVPCARLQTTFIPETGQLELRGHIPEDGLRGAVLEALRAQVGDAIPLADQLLILPRPQCGALAGIAAIGLPQSTEQLTNPAVIGADGFARTFEYGEGERLILDLTAPDYDAYVYLDYFVADGTVIHLQPNEVVPLEFAPAKSALSVGRARDDGKPSLELTISAPFGQEIAAAFAASSPLYEGTRPIQEDADTYLQFLKERVAAARAKHPDFKGEWVYFFITTSGS